MSAPARVDAICLSCGTVRTVAASRILYGGEPLERHYKCATCRQRTMHGSAAGVPDARERANARAILRTDDPWAEIESRGWQVIEAPGLKDAATIVDNTNIVLVRHGLSEDVTRDVVKWALEQIAGERPLLEQAIEHLGWRVVIEPDLPDAGCIVRSQRVVLVRDGLDDDDRDTVLANILLEISRGTGA